MHRSSILKSPKGLRNGLSMKVMKLFDPRLRITEKIRTTWSKSHLNMLSFLYTFERAVEHSMYPLFCGNRTI